MSQDFQDVFEKARKLELDGAEFYEEVAAKCAVASGKRMFESFAKDERRHFQILTDVAEGMGVDAESMPMPRDEIRTLFTGMAEDMGEQLQASADEQEAVRIALDMERKSYELYRDQAEEAEEGQVRALLERLAREENQHYEMLENTLEYMTGNQKWFLWNEWALIMGDQSSIGMD
jgi:rubrerythrin